MEKEKKHSLASNHTDRKGGIAYRLEKRRLELPGKREKRDLSNNNNGRGVSIGKGSRKEKKSDL